MKIQCPYCQAEMEIQPEHLGKRGDCPACKAEMQIPVLPAKFIDPPQPEPVSVRMIARGVVRGLLLYVALFAAIGLLLLVIFVAVSIHRADANIRAQIEAIERAKIRANEANEAIRRAESKARQ